jgi:hypothetical protein
MAPLVRRSWALKGHPPAMRQKSGHREKVSVAGALWLTPGRDRLGLAFQTLVNGYFNNEAVADFVGLALQGWEEPVIVIWDRGSMHQGDPLRDLVEQAAERLDIEPLPPQASELMPMEQVWTWLKYSRLCNFAPEDAHELDQAVTRELEGIQDDQGRLRNFFHASALPLPRTLLF